MKFERGTICGFGINDIPESLHSIKQNYLKHIKHGRA